MATTPNASPPGRPVRDRILAAARGLLASGGPEALTNRAVAAAAETQPPVIYRVFGDKQGLLQALAEEVFAEHLADKSSLQATDDPVADLRTGFDQHVAFGLANPVVYVMVYGAVAEKAPQPAAAEAERMLAAYVHRVAKAGQLRVPEALATQMMHAAGRGVALTLIGLPPQVWHPDLSAATREAVITAITTDAAATTSSSLASSAIALRADVHTTSALTPAERRLMTEWLDRIANTPQPTYEMPR